MMMNFLKPNPKYNNDDECMKTIACILLRVICERNLGLCHQDVLKMRNYRDFMHSVCILIGLLSLL